MPTQRCDCGARYRFPDTAIGKRAKCKKCGTILTLADEDDLAPIPIADDAFADEVATAAERAQSSSSSASGEGLPVSAAYLPTSETVGRLGPVVIEEAEYSPDYFRDLLAALVVPNSIHNSFVFVAIWIGLFIGGFIPYVSWILIGWYAAFRFNVVASAAGGDMNLPAEGMPNDFLEDIIYPMFRWGGSWIVVMLPAIAYAIIATHQGWLPPGAALDVFQSGITGILQGVSEGMLALVALVILGMFLWPVIVLCVAIGGFGTVQRLDLIIPTVLRTLPGYIITVAMVFGVEGVKYLLASGVEAQLTIEDGSSFGGMLGALFSIAFVVRGISIYFDIVAMRIIGLYYHHFKDRFAWSWG